MTASSTFLPSIQKTVRVGVTGHRSLPPASLHELKRTVEDVLHRIRRVVERAEPPAGCERAFAGGVRLMITSPIARGADQLVATIAKRLGYELQCPLPFPREEYRKDFGTGSHEAEAFDHLLAGATAIVELDGERAQSSAAYEAVGRVVIEQSDVLIAVWDGEKAAGVGGTGQIVAEAVELQLPVVVIPPDHSGDAYLSIVDRRGQAHSLALDELETRLAGILFPYHGVAGREDARTKDVTEAEAAELYRRQAQNYADFCGEKHPARRWTSRFLVGKLWGSFWDAFMTLFRVPTWRDPAREAPAPGEDARAQTPHQQFFYAHYEWASRLANYYADLYRSSFFINYVLAAVAVTAVLLSHALHRHAAWFLSLELFCIGVILLTFLLGRRWRWHERAVDYRILAEQFRQMRYLAPMALAIPSTRPPAHFGHHGDLTGTWMNWHFRFVLRNAGMESARFDQAYVETRCRWVLDEWLRTQREYHHRNHRRLTKAHRFCETLIALFFAGTAIACGAHLFLPHMGLSPATAGRVSAMSPWLIVLAASLPAWAAAFHGIAGQGEFERLSERSRSMEQRLGSMIDDFQAFLGEGARLDSRALKRHASEAAAVMLAEVVDWRVLYRAHDIPRT